jgi:hypothetical protein
MENEGYFGKEGIVDCKEGREIQGSGEEFGNCVFDEIISHECYIAFRRQVFLVFHRTPFGLLQADQANFGKKMYIGLQHAFCHELFYLLLASHWHFHPTEGIIYLLQEGRIRYGL